MHPTLLVTGAAGRLGRFLLRNPPEGWRLRLTDLVVPTGAAATPAPGVEWRQLDVTDRAAARAACDGADAVLHLAGIADNAPATRELLIPVNIGGTRNVLDAAAGAGVRRVLLAGSNHAVGFARRSADGPLPDDIACRPDSPYGVTKAAMEALASFHADEFGTEVVLLRIGSCFERPLSARMLATWLSPADFCRLVAAGLRAPVAGCLPVWGVSANTRRWWSTAGGQALGYVPRDDAETFAAEIEGASAGDGAGAFTGEAVAVGAADGAATASAPTAGAAWDITAGAGPAGPVDPRGETVGGAFPAAASAAWAASASAAAPASAASVATAPSVASVAASAADAPDQGVSP